MEHFQDLQDCFPFSYDQLYSKLVRQKFFVSDEVYKKEMPMTGIEPVSPRPQRGVLTTILHRPRERLSNSVEVLAKCTDKDCKVRAQNDERISSIDPKKQNYSPVRDSNPWPLD